MNNAIRYEVQDTTVVITIDRPEARNAINDDVRLGLREALRRFDQDEGLRCAILTGSGDKAFCAGMDLKMMAAMPNKPFPRDYLPVIGQSMEVKKPTICAVNGVATAGGWLFAQMCDLCIAADHARFGITEAKVGRGMPWAPPLIHMLPQRFFMELMLTGDMIDAQRAMEIGFVNRVVPLADLMPTALQMAAKIAANAPLTVQAAREVVYLSTEMSRTAALRAADHVFDRVYRSQDAIEGPTAFKEKRAPNWRGC
jgi:enoyl-CoA hydratase/carnithine racemase